MFLNYFNIYMLKIIFLNKKYYFNIFLNKKYFKKSTIFLNKKRYHIFK